MKKKEINGIEFLFERDPYCKKLWNTYIINNGQKLLNNIESESLTEAMDAAELCAFEEMNNIFKGK